MRGLALLLLCALLGCGTEAGDRCDQEKPSCPADQRCWLGPKDDVPRCTTTAAAREACAQGASCKRDGDCTFLPIGNGVCGPGKAEDCKASEICRSIGECTLQDGMCVVGSEEDCKQSEGCKTSGRCKLDLEGLKPQCGEVR